MKRLLVVLTLLLVACGSAPARHAAPAVPGLPDFHDRPVAPQQATISNGTQRYTVDGKVIDAHDGMIAEFNGTYYLYGTSYGCGFQWTVASSPFCGFNVYSSPDLMHWTGPAKLFDPGAYWQQLCMQPSGSGCFRPHVIFNSWTGQYALWVNVPGGYRALTSSTPTGPFFLESAVPVQGGDMALFADKGVGYVAYNNGGRIFLQRLATDYLGVVGLAMEVSGWPDVPPFHGAEAPSIFQRLGTYYMTLSVPQCPYCNATGTGYLTAPSMVGPWTYRGLISDKSCGGQPTAVSQLGDAYLYQSDQWLETPNEYAATQFWAALTFSGSAINSIACTDHSVLALDGTTE